MKNPKDLMLDKKEKTINSKTRQMNNLKGLLEDKTKEQPPILKIETKRIKIELEVACKEKGHKKIYLKMLKLLTNQVKV